MVDCKKCLHAPVCEKLPKMPGAIIAECAEFKDSTKWVERPKGRWIPVTERLPEKNTAVIAVTDNGIVFQCLYAYDGWDLWEGNEVHITHWMPLPEPPKEE